MAGIACERDDDNDVAHVAGIHDGRFLIFGYRHVGLIRRETVEVVNCTVFTRTMTDADVGRNSRLIVACFVVEIGEISVGLCSNPAAFTRSCW